MSHGTYQQSPNRRRWAVIVGQVTAIVAGTVLVLWVLASAIQTVVVPRATPIALTRVHFLTIRRFFDWAARPSRTYETRDRVLALYAPISLVLLAGRLAGVADDRLHRHLLGLRDRPGVRRVRHIRVVAVHPRLRPSGRLRASGAELPRGRVRPRPAVADDLVPADDLQRVPNPRGAGRHARGPRRHPALSDAAPRPVLADRLARPARGRPLRRLGAMVRRRRGEPHQPGIPGVLPVAHSISQLDHGRGMRARLSRACTPRRSTIRRMPAPTCSSAPGSSACAASPTSTASPTTPTRHRPIRSRSHATSSTRCAPNCRPPASPLKPDRDQAWRDFAGWRVNYDTVLLSLASMVTAPYAKWSSDRAPTRRHRPKLRRRRSG